MDNSLCVVSCLHPPQGRNLQNSVLLQIVARWHLGSTWWKWMSLSERIAPSLDTGLLQSWSFFKSACPSSLCNVEDEPTLWPLLHLDFHVQDTGLLQSWYDLRHLSCESFSKKVTCTRPMGLSCIMAVATLGHQTKSSGGMNGWHVRKPEKQWHVGAGCLLWLPFVFDGVPESLGRPWPIDGVNLLFKKISSYRTWMKSLIAVPHQAALGSNQLNFRSTVSM